MTNPSRGQFPRSNVTGARPASLHPGSFAVNWRDKVIWVGDASGNAVRFSRRIETYDPASTYNLDDFVVIGADLWRALGTVLAGTPFTPSQWQRVSAAGRAEIAQPYASEIYSGGAATRVTDTSVSIGSGSGVIVDNINPAQVTSTPVAWSPFLTTLAPLSTPVTILGINAAGSLVHVTTDAFTDEWRRRHIMLGLIIWAADGTIFSVRDASVRAAGDAEALRDEYFVNGGAYRASGGRIVPSGLGLKHGKAEVFALGARWRSRPLSPNVIPVPAADLFPIIPVTAKAILGPASPVVQVQLYDPDGDGTPIPLPAGYHSIQYLYSTFDMQQFFLQLGQTAYETQFDAISAVTEDHASLVSFAPGVGLMLLAAIITGSDTVALNAAVFGDPFAVAGTAVASSVDYYLRDGSRPMTGDMDMAGFEIENAVLDGGSF